MDSESAKSESVQNRRARSKYPERAEPAQAPQLQSKYVNIAANPGRSVPRGGKALAGFLLSGFLLAFLGAILPAWGYHRDPAHFTAIGNYFLSLPIGLIAATRLAGTILARRGLSFLLVAGCVLSCSAL